MPELQPILDLLPASWKTGLVWFFSVVGALRICIKPAGNLLKARITSAIETASNSIDPFDDTWIESFLGSRPYRFIAFLFDWLASVKLPSRAELHQPKPPTPSAP